MFIINIKERPANIISKFTITFKDIQGCGAVARELELLVNDDYANIWQVFQGDAAQKLSESSINGLIVFLSCVQSSSVISGEYFSLDCDADGELLTNYVSEAQNDAYVDIEEQVVAA